MLCNYRSNNTKFKIKIDKGEEKTDSVCPEKEQDTDAGMTSLNSDVTDDINWDDFKMYQHRKGPEFMKEINSPRAETQRRASLGNLRRRSSSVISMTASAGSKSKGSSSITRRKHQDVNSGERQKRTEIPSGTHNQKIHRKEEAVKNRNKKMDTEKVTMTEHNTEFENEKIINDHRNISGAVNGSVRNNHGHIVYDPNKTSNQVTGDVSDDILVQITAKINALAEKAPDWLTDILMGNISPTSPVNRKPAYTRLAHRAGTRASADLKTRLLSSVG